MIWFTDMKVKVTVETKIKVSIIYTEVIKEFLNSLVVINVTN